jgi:hypothetical protein
VVSSAVTTPLYSPPQLTVTDYLSSYFALMALNKAIGFRSSGFSPRLPARTDKEEESEQKNTISGVVFTLTLLVSLLAYLSHFLDCNL